MSIQTVATFLYPIENANNVRRDLAAALDAEFPKQSDVFTQPASNKCTYVRVSVHPSIAGTDMADYVRIFARGWVAARPPQR